MTDAPPRVVRLEPGHARALARLFERCDNACYCRYFHFQGDKYAWQDRLANAPDKNRAELIARVTEQHPEVTGVIALRDRVDPEGEPDDCVVGWLKVSPASALEKLYGQRLYRGLPCFDRSAAGVFTLGCFFIDPSHRGRGLARQLLAGAISLARDLGATSLEALPRGGDSVSEAERWLGRPEHFVDAGFALVHDFGPYPVFRLKL